MGFSATEAAFEGFRLVRERPVIAAAWGLFYTAAVIGVIVLLFLLMGGSLAAFSGGAAPAGGSVVFALLIGVLAFLMLMSVLTAAVYRAVLRPNESRMAFLRVGSVEVRLMLLFVAIALIILALLVVGMLIHGVLYNVLPDAAAGFGIAIGWLLILGLLLWIAVRLSLVGPMTLFSHGLPFGAGWRLAGGRFWPLLGAYAIAWVLTVVIAIAGSILSMALLAGFGGGFSALSQMNNPDFGAFTPGLAIGFVLYAAVQLVLGLLQFVIMSAPAAAAYQRLGRRETPEDAF